MPRTRGLSSEMRAIKQQTLVVPISTAAIRLPRGRIAGLRDFALRLPPDGAPVGSLSPTDASSIALMCSSLRGALFSKPASLSAARDCPAVRADREAEYRWSARPAARGQPTAQGGRVAPTLPRFHRREGARLLRCRYGGSSAYYRRGWQRLREPRDRARSPACREIPPHGSRPPLRQPWAAWRTGRAGPPG